MPVHARDYWFVQGAGDGRRGLTTALWALM